MIDAPDKVTLPVFSTTNPNVSVSPNDTAPDPSSSAFAFKDFVSESPGSAGIETLTLSSSVMSSAGSPGLPPGRSPLTVAVLPIEPASTSAWVTL